MRLGRVVALRHPRLRTGTHAGGTRKRSQAVSTVVSPTSSVTTQTRTPLSIRNSL
jgi:hypothetical protein